MGNNPGTGVKQIKDIRRKPCRFFSLDCCPERTNLLIAHGETVGMVIKED